MSKRFTETEKWRDPWFRKLSPQAKLLFLWLVDNCDKAGVIELDFEAASFDIGQPVKSDHLTELQGRWEQLANGKMRLTKFVAFQYGTLSEKCTPHLRVIEALRSHGLYHSEQNQTTLPATLPDASNSSKLEKKSTTLHTTLPTRVGTTLEEKRGVGQEGNGGEPEKREGCGEGESNGVLDPVFVRDLMATYRRAVDSRLSHLEESTLAEIIRERPRYRAEFDLIISLKQKEPRYFPQSLAKLLSGWQETLDRANSHVPASTSKTASTVFEITKVIEAKTKLADELKRKHASEGPLSTDWSPPEKRTEYLTIRGEIKQLTRQLAGMA
jgi:hypothetical protein